MKRTEKISYFRYERRARIVRWLPFSCARDCRALRRSQLKAGRPPRRMDAGPASCLTEVFTTGICRRHSRVDAAHVRRHGMQYRCDSLWHNAGRIWSCEWVTLHHSGEHDIMWGWLEALTSIQDKSIASIPRESFQAMAVSRNECGPVQNDAI